MAVATTFEKELKKIFGDDLILNNTKYVGRDCYGEIDDNIRMKAHFVTMDISGQYNALRLELINRTEGEIDAVVIRLNEIWGKKDVPGNPNFRNGVFPHLWLNGDKLGWYVYQPTTRDFEILRESVKEYTSVFKDFSLEKEQKPSIKKQLADNKDNPSKKKPTKNKNTDLEV